MNPLLQPFHTFAAGCTESSFFGLPTWYHYLVLAKKMVADPTTGRCVFANYNNGSGGFALNDISLVALGVVDILLRLAALVAIGYVMYGGFTFITAQGEPDKVKRAQGTIFNALIGLGISLAAVGAVSFAGKALGG